MRSAMMSHFSVTYRKRYHFMQEKVQEWWNSVEHDSLYAL